MTWRQSVLEKYSSWLRWVTRAFWLVCGGMIALFVVYVLGKGLWRLAEWLDRHILGSPW